MFGFAGLSFGPEGISFDPRLPDQWQKLSFSVQWRGRKIHIGIDAVNGRVDAELRDGAAMPLTVRGVAYDLQPGQTVEVSLKP